MDPISKDYPELTPYQFASNTPIGAIDLDGLESFWIAGTGQGGANWWNRGANTRAARAVINEMFGHNGSPENETTPSFHLLDWNGENNTKARIKEGVRLAAEIAGRRTGTEPITIVGHSHGGNVAIVAAHELITNYGIAPEDINLVLFNTPKRHHQRTDKHYNGNLGTNYAFQAPKDAITYAVETYWDWVQWGGELYLDQYAELNNNERNVDYIINYTDQFSDGIWIPGIGGQEHGIFGTWLGVGNHLGPTDENLDEWHAPLQAAVIRQKSTRK